MVIELPRLPADDPIALNAITLGFLAAALVVLLTTLAEVVHTLRIRTAAPLAFGPSRRGPVLAVVSAVLRVIALGLLTWGLTVLLVLPPKSTTTDQVRDTEYRHLVLVLDVSRSMTVEDSGPDGTQPRRERAADIIQSFFERVRASQYKTTVVAVAAEAKPVVIDTADREVVRNILSDLPIRHAFQPGETDLFAGLEEAAKVAKAWPPGSAVLMVVTDGDTVPATGIPRMPASIGDNVLMVGVGDPDVGKSLGGHTTRQDVSTLRQVATRLHGDYHDGNEKHLSTDLVTRIDERATPAGLEKWTIREFVLLCIGIGAAVLAVIPVVLLILGTGWEPGRRPRRR